MSPPPGPLCYRRVSGLGVPAAASVVRLSDRRRAGAGATAALAVGCPALREI